MSEFSDCAGKRVNKYAVCLICMLRIHMQIHKDNRRHNNIISELETNIRQAIPAAIAILEVYMIRYDMIKEADLI